MALRIIFFGTAELACPSLEALSQSNEFSVLAVVTQPDKPKGRDLKVLPSALKAAALDLGLPVLQPKKAREESFIAEMRAQAPDLFVVVAYGQILSQTLLDVPKYGAINVHTSLLPRHRGAAPIQWAILSGDRETGVTIMKMDAGLDTGPILTQERTPILDSDNSQTLHDRLAERGAKLLVRTIPDFVSGKLQLQAQPEGATYARKISKEDGLLQWGESAQALWNKVRAFTPWPGAYTFHQEHGQRRLLKIWEAVPGNGSGQPGTILKADKTGIVIACGAGALEIKMLQREGGKRLTAEQFVNGNLIKVGDRLGG
jgi:methionyl-tRNA formyltransferase